MFELTKRQTENFWEKVNKENTTRVYNGHSCWEWTAYTNHCGHGTFSINSKKEFAHRVSWALKNGYMPYNSCVCHACDNPKCVNPEHLWIGDRLENNKDRQYKKRIIMRHIAINILDLYYIKNTSIDLISKKLNLSRQNIKYVIKGKYWEDVYKKEARWE
jgi:hypothetical protein